MMKCKERLLSYDFNHTDKDQLLLFKFGFDLASYKNLSHFMKTMD